MRELTSNYTLILPKKCGFRKAGSANQTIFQFLIKKMPPAKIQKICRKIGWFAPPASLAGGAAGRASNIPFKKGSCFVQQLQPNRILRPMRQNAPAATEGQAGFFCWSGGGSALLRNAQKGLLFSDFSKVPLCDTKQPVFNPTLYGLGA